MPTNSQLQQQSQKKKRLPYGLVTYTSGVQQVHHGLKQLNDKNSFLVQGSQRLADGTNTLGKQVPTLVQGIQALDKGANDLSHGMETLVSNNVSLLSGSQSLSQGADQISNGASQLANGLNDVRNGTASLHTGLKDGAKKSQLTTSDETYDMLASPVVTNHKEISTVENNGHAMAPYMMSVALYVACLAFALMYPLLKDVHKATSGFQYWLSKSTIWFFISIVAAMAMIGSLMIFNGFRPQQTFMTFVFAIVVAAAFMSLVT